MDTDGGRKGEEAGNEFELMNSGKNNGEEKLRITRITRMRFLEGQVPSCPRSINSCLTQRREDAKEEGRGQPV